MRILSLLSSVSLALIACGGGSGSVDQTSQASAIDKYVGVWKSNCLGDQSDVREVSGNGPTNARQTLEFTKLNATKLNTKVTLSYFATDDKDCSKASIGSVTLTGDNTGSESFGASGITSSLGQNIFDYTGGVTLAAGQKVDRFIVTTASLSTTNSTVTAGKINVDTKEFVGVSSQSITYFKNTNQFVIASDNSYPSVIDDASDLLYTKQ